MPECHPRAGFSFAEVSSGAILRCRCTAELHILNDEYIRQWHLTMHINRRDNASVTAIVLRSLTKGRQWTAALMSISLQPESGTIEAARPWMWGSVSTSHSYDNAS